ncbi:MAG TPA: hypothetical protein VIL15_04980 [Coriobacteriia bacterium]
MPDNVLDIGGQWFSIIAGTLTLFGACMVFALRHRSGTKPGSAGNRPPEEEGDSERVSPDGYIDSFANIISEGGGGLPVMGMVAAGVTLVAYFAYMILFWQPK